MEPKNLELMGVKALVEIDAQAGAAFTPVVSPPTPRELDERLALIERIMEALMRGDYLAARRIWENRE